VYHFEAAQPVFWGLLVLPACTIMSHVPLLQYHFWSVPFTPAVQTTPVVVQHVVQRGDVCFVISHIIAVVIVVVVVDCGRRNMPASILMLQQQSQVFALAAKSILASN
jgi:hypothetical protein